MQVSFGITQSFEYFKAANSVTIAISPLLYFYGMLSLAKSLIVANNRELYFEDIMYHGLTQKSKDVEIEDYNKKPEIWTMEKEFAVLRQGVAGHLTKLFCDFQFPDDAIIYFKDLLFVCPEIAQMYELLYSQPSRTIYLYSFYERQNPYSFDISPHEKDEREIFRRIPELEKDFTMLPDLMHGLARTFRSKNLPKFPDYFGIYNPPVGGKYIIGGLNYRLNSDHSSRYIQPIISDYFALYILSMCVRYKQEFWGEIIQGEKSGIVGLIELYLSVVKRRYPNAILNSLFGYEFSYGAPSRLM